MASEAEQNDALLALRTAIAAGITPLLSTTEDASTGTDNFAQATHLHIGTASGSQSTFPLRAETRYNGIDLRSVYFTWLNRDKGTAAYVSARNAADKELAQNGVQGQIKQLPFTERTDLIAWLDGTNEESENLRPLDAARAAQQAERAAAITAGTAEGAPAAGLGGEVKAPGARGKGQLDPKLAKIYAGERKMGDRNSILRGIKPTVCSPSTFPTHSWYEGAG